MTGEKDRGRHSLDALYLSFPELTIAEDWLASYGQFTDRVGEGLAALGMRYG
jgi:hypothetical protein